MLVLIDPVIKSDKSCFPQVLLEECKYNVKDKEIKTLKSGDWTISESENESEVNEDNFRNQI